MTNDERALSPDVDTEHVRPSADQAPSRRAFLRGSALAIAGGGAAAVASGCEYRSQLFLISGAPKLSERPSPDWREARVRAYRPLGRTQAEMSDIAFGCAGLEDPAVVRRALERGVNYFDTSPDYSRSGSEKALGLGIRGQARDRLFLVSKFCTPEGHLADDTPVKDVIAAVEASLQRLQTDYLDLAHIHACNSIERLMAPNIHEAADRLREQGKLRFIGVSSHTPRLEQVMRHAVDCGRFDVIMVAYNFKNWPDLTNIFRDAQAKGVGVVAMKTLKGAKHTALADFTADERQSFPQAAFKWVLANPHVSGLVVSIDSLAQIDEYLHASGQTVARADVDLLDRYDQLVSADYCRPGCGLCLDSCPASVPIDDVLRYSMYYESYGHQRIAMQDYAAVPLEHNASQCLGCSAPCEASCPFGVRIGSAMRRAHSQLVST